MRNACRVTTLTNLVLDGGKMAIIREWRWAAPAWWDGVSGCQSSFQQQGQKAVTPLQHTTQSPRPCTRARSRNDPLTGGSSIISPEVKLGTAVAALFFSFFSLAQVQ